MGLELAKDAIDLGIITRDAAPMVAFYRDLLGFTDEGQMPVPGIGTMYRLRCGSSLIKITEADPKADAAPGGLAGATGMRYWTISVVDVDAAAEMCRQAGHEPVIPPRDIRPGVRIAMFADPDGNWVELLQS